MIHTLDYSAGLVSQSFWFLEFKKVMKLRYEGMEYDDIKERCNSENLFGATNAYRANRMAGYIIRRATAIEPALMELFMTSDLATQKLINLIAILRTDRLFFEFLYECYREKVILGVEHLEDTEVNVFFTKKAAQSEAINEWTDATKKRLRSCYMNFMTDANLLSVVEKKRMITPPILDIALERYLEANNEKAIAKALTGVE